jgi:hypothetical protein
MGMRDFGIDGMRAGLPLVSARMARTAYLHRFPGLSVRHLVILIISIGALDHRYVERENGVM